MLGEKRRRRRLITMYVVITATSRAGNVKPPIIAITISTAIIIRKMNLVRLSCQDRFLNFIENIGISLTSSQHSTGTTIAGNQ